VLYPLESNEEEKEEKTHYIFLCKKSPNADAVCAENYDAVI
jgi:hypothetical protein